MRYTSASKRRFLQGYKVTTGHTGDCPICHRPIAKTDEVHLETGDRFVGGKIILAKAKHMACWMKAATVEQVPTLLGGPA